MLITKTLVRAATLEYANNVAMDIVQKRRKRIDGWEIIRRLSFPTHMRMEDCDDKNHNHDSYNIFYRSVSC